MAFRVRRRRNINVIKVGVKIIATVIGLYASGIMLTTMGDIMNGTCSPFYTGLKLIGWTVATAECSDIGTDGVNTANTITATSGTGILAVIGLLAVVWVVFEFVDISM